MAYLSRYQMFAILPSYSYLHGLNPLRKQPLVSYGLTGLFNAILSLSPNILANMTISVPNAIIDRREFLSIYIQIYGHAFSIINIPSGFGAANLISSKLKRVLARLYIKIKISIPSSSSDSNQSFHLRQTLANLYQLSQ